MRHDLAAGLQRDYEKHSEENQESGQEAWQGCRPEMAAAWVREQLPSWGYVVESKSVLRAKPT